MTPTHTLPAGTGLIRAHPHAFGSTEFDRRPDADARFSPLSLGDPPPLGVICAGSNHRTAAAETIFHRLPTGDRRRRVALDLYLPWQWSTIVVTRDVRLAPIDRHWPNAADLIDGDATTYPRTRALMAGLLRDHPDLDGCIWPSAQLHERPSARLLDPTTDATILLVARVAARSGGLDRDQLQPHGPSIPFVSAEGRARLDEVAVHLGVTIVRS